MIEQSQRSMFEEVEDGKEKQTAPGKAAEVKRTRRKRKKLN